MSIKNKKAFANLMEKNRENYIKNKAHEDGFMTAMVFCCWCLHDKHGYGAKRLDKLIEEVHQMVKDVADGYIVAKDILEQLEEETKIKIFR